MLSVLPSARIQEIILNKIRELVQSEKVVHNYEVTALRPDYYFRTGGAGILLEVEERPLPMAHGPDPRKLHLAACRLLISPCSV